MVSKEHILWIQNFRVWKTPQVNVSITNGRLVFPHTTTWLFTDRSILCSCHTAAAPYTSCHYSNFSETLRPLFKRHTNWRNKKHRLFKWQKWQRGWKMKRKYRQRLDRASLKCPQGSTGCIHIREACKESKKKGGWKMKEKEPLVVEHVWINSGGHIRVSAIIAF